MLPNIPTIDKMLLENARSGAKLFFSPLGCKVSLTNCDYHVVIPRSLSSAKSLPTHCLGIHSPFNNLHIFVVVAFVFNFTNLPYS